MENLLATSSWNAMSDEDNSKLRMSSRPPPPLSDPVHTRRTGMATEDLGSSFEVNTKQRKTKPPSKAKKRPAEIPDFDSPDELDILPPSSRAGSRAGSVVDEDELDRKDMYMDEKGVYHKFHPSYQNKSDVLKLLKFNKVKPPQGGDQALYASSSQPPVLKEYENAEASRSRKLSPLSKPTQTNARRERSP
ncbi:hypothetical protein C0993_003856, partial [Termitomyces sp. T159_Od127]